MTPAQRNLARQALGLGLRWSRSGRNVFVAPHASPAVGEWREMVAAGEAVQREPGGPFARFELTRAGAELALDPGESLNPEHFPPIGQD